MGIRQPEAFRAVQKRAGEIFSQIIKRHNRYSPEVIEIKERGLTYIAQDLTDIIDGIPQGRFEYALPEPIDPTKNPTVVIATGNVQLAYDTHGIHVQATEKDRSLSHGFYMSFHRDPGDQIAYTITVDKKTTLPIATNRTQDSRSEADTISRRIALQILDSARFIREEVYNRTQDALGKIQAGQELSPAERRSLLAAEDLVLRTPFPQFEDLLAADLPPSQTIVGQANTELSRIDKIADETKTYPHYAEHTRKNEDTGVEILRTMLTDMGDLTHLYPLSSTDLPFALTNPEGAAFVARNSVLVFNATNENPVGMLFASPDSGYLIYQLISRPDLPLAPTLFFRDPTLNIQPGEPTIQVGFTSYGNPNDIKQTALYPMAKDSVQLANLVAPELLRVVLASSRTDFPLIPRATDGMPYIGSYAGEWNNNGWTFEDYTQRVIQAATPDKNIVTITPMYERSRRGEHIHGIDLLYGRQKSFGALIEVNPQQEQTTLILEMAQQIGEERRATQLTLLLGDRGIQLNGILLDPNTIKQHEGIRANMRRAHFILGKIYDSWTILQKQQTTYVSETAQEDIPDVLEYLLRVINADGTLNASFPYKAPFSGGRVDDREDYFVPRPLIDETQTLQAADLLPTPITMLEEFEEDSFLGSLAREQYRRGIEQQETRLLPTILLPRLPDYRDGELEVAELLDDTALARVAFFEEIAKEEQTGNTRPSLPLVEDEATKSNQQPDTPLANVFAGWETLDEEGLPERDRTTTPLPKVDEERTTQVRKVSPPAARRQSRRRPLPRQPKSKNE